MEQKTAQKEYLHTPRSYQSAGIEPFVEQASQYILGKRTKPISKTYHRMTNKEILFTFSDTLLEEFINNLDSIDKPYEVALKYGFQGYSRGEKNGILLIREEKKDKKLITSTNSLMNQHKEELEQDLDIQNQGLDELRKVKIVWHEPSGQRIVGAYNTKKDKMMFLDFAHY